MIDTVRANSKHLSNLLLLEFAYCILLFTSKTFFLEDLTVVKIAYLLLILPVPIVFNIFCYLNFKRKTEFEKANNFLIVGILLIMLTTTFLL